MAGFRLGGGNRGRFIVKLEFIVILKQPAVLVIMTHPNWTVAAYRRRGCTQAFSALVLCLLAFAQSLRAQSILTAPPESSIIPPAMQEYQSNRVGVVQLPELVAPGAPKAPLELGPVALRPHVLYRLLYGNGISYSPSNQTSTAVNEISPGLLFGIGRHFTLDYTPTLRYYSSDKFRDSLDHSVLLTGGTTYEDWVLGLSQGYTLTALPEVETGIQTTEESFLTTLTASYRFNSKMSMDLDAQQAFISAEGSATGAALTGHREWSTLDWLNYEFWSNLAASIGVGFGYLDMDTGPDATYEKLEGRITWRVVDKTSLQLIGGVEDRQFQSGGAGNLINPILGAAILYRPVETTTLSLHADSVVSASYFADQVAETTGFSASLDQRLITKLYLIVGGGYNRVRYVASTPGVSPNRTDDYYFFSSRLSWRFLKRGTVAVFYQYSDNSSSSESGFTFSSNQVGLELGYRY